MSPKLPTSDSTIPIVEEELHVERTEVETGAVRIRVRTASRTEVVDEPTTLHGVEVERVPRGTFVEERKESWLDGEVMVVPVYREVIVRRTLLVEEIRLIPTTSVHQEQQSLELSSERPVFERQNPDGAWIEVSFAELQNKREQ